MDNSLIKRQDAIDTANTMRKRCDTNDIDDYHDLMVEALEELPSVDPKTAESGSVEKELPEIKSDRTNGGLISRQDAIDAVMNTEPVFNLDTFDQYQRTEDVINAIEQLPSAQTEQRWVPVSERLPEDETDVLVTRECKGKRYVEEACCMNGEWVAYSDEYKIGDRKKHKVLAWMEKVEPYKGDES